MSSHEAWTTMLPKMYKAIYMAGDNDNAIGNQSDHKNTHLLAQLK